LGVAEELQGTKVAVIDDSKTIRRTAEMILQKAGCTVMSAEDGFSALSMVVEFQPQIIFIDILMPRLDGYQTCSLLKQNDRFSNIPIIMLSSKDGLFDRAKARIAGSDEYLTKPFTKNEILEAIQRNL
jgi:twitching motility two-component system response regulator PilG